MFKRNLTTIYLLFCLKSIPAINKKGCCILANYSSTCGARKICMF